MEQVTDAIADTTITENNDKNKEEKEQVVTPWTVQSEGAVDYEKLIVQFGCQRLTEDVCQRMERLTGKKLHRWIRRGMFFSHRDFNKILDLYEMGTKFFLYTGRGPASNMHLGHMIPFQFTQVKYIYLYVYGMSCVVCCLDVVLCSYLC